MQVIHVHANGASSEYDSAFITMVVGALDGVRDIATLPSRPDLGPLRRRTFGRDRDRRGGVFGGLRCAGVSPT